MTNSISDYDHKSDSVSLKLIDGKVFNIIGVEDSNYTEGEKSTPGVKITTKESFKVKNKDGAEVESNKFHTTRVGIVSQLKNEKLRADIDSGAVIGPVKAELNENVKPGKKPFWELVEVTQ